MKLMTSMASTVQKSFCVFNKEVKYQLYAANKILSMPRNKKLHRGQCQIVLGMWLWLLWQSVRGFNLDNISETDILKKKNLTWMHLQYKAHWLYQRGMTSLKWREGQSVTETIFVLINHKSDALMMASVVMHSASASWSMGYWMKLLLVGHKYLERNYLFLQESFNTAVQLEELSWVWCAKQEATVIYQFVILICRSLWKPLKSSVLKFTVIYGTNIKQDILTRLRPSYRSILPGLS